MLSWLECPRQRRPDHDPLAIRVLVLAMKLDPWIYSRIKPCSPTVREMIGYEG
jgi:hypothetical protein